MPMQNLGVHPPFFGTRASAIIGPVTSASSAAMAANRLYFAPMKNRANDLIEALIALVQTGAAGNARFGAFTNNNGRPETLIQEIVSDLSTASAAQLTASFSAALRLPSAYFAAVCFSGTPTMYRLAGASHATSEAIEACGGLSASQMTGSLVGFFHMYRTTALTYVNTTAFFPSSIAANDITYDTNTPGSPALYARKSA